MAFRTPGSSPSAVANSAATAAAAVANAAAPSAALRSAPDSESQPLLPRAAEAPLLARLLLRLSGRTLRLILLCCFFCNLVRRGQLQAWGRDVLISVEADGLYLMLFIGSLTTGVITLTNLSVERLLEAGPLQAFGALTLLASAHGFLCWIAMLRICLLRELPVNCLFHWFCRYTKEGAPHVPLLMSWAWFPYGFFSIVFETLWLPWRFIFHDVPSAIAGEGGLDAIPWSVWREVVIGTVFWHCMAFVVYLGRSEALRREAADRRFLLFVGIACGLGCTLAVFYLTVPPMITFWKFLFRPWQLIAQGVLQYRLPQLAAEQWVACLSFAWYVGRGVYIGTRGRYEQWSARQRMEDTLQEALAHPFRAELEQGFGLIHGDHAVGLIPRLVSLQSHERSKGLSEKQRKLIANRKELLLRSVGGRAALPSQLQLTIRRQSLLEDTVPALFDRPVSELLAPKVSVKFDGEAGIDAGGLAREWFDAVGRALGDQALSSSAKSVFLLGPDQTLIPRSLGCDVGDVPQNQLEQFRALVALGRFMALAVFHQRPLPVSFSLILCKHILRVPVDMGDVRCLDPEFYNLRVARVLAPNGPDRVAAELGEPLTFMSAASEHCVEPRELKPGGAQTKVTEANKTEYVQLLCEAYLCGGIRREIQCLLQGFWDVLPPEVLRDSALGPRELSLLLSGIERLDAEQWRKHSNCGGRETQVHKWFWEIVREMDNEQRSMLLHFTTGSSRLPIGGFAELRPPFSVSVTDAGSPEHLPHSHTCANHIVLHRYKSKDNVREKLLPALFSEDFGFC